MENLINEKPLLLLISTHHGLYEWYVLIYLSNVEKEGRSRAIVMIVVPIVVSVILFSFCCCLLRRKARKSYKTILKENCTYYAKQEFQYKLSISKLREICKLSLTIQALIWSSWTWKYYCRATAIRFGYNWSSNKQFFAREQDWQRWIWRSL